MAKQSYRHELRIIKPRMGELIDTPLGKLCPPCHDAMHQFCDWGKCACQCHTAKREVHHKFDPKTAPKLPLDGVAWERQKTE